jgi:hypothetical protein
LCAHGICAAAKATGVGDALRGVAQLRTAVASLTTEHVVSVSRL